MGRAPGGEPEVDETVELDTLSSEEDDEVLELVEKVGSDSLEEGEEQKEEKEEEKKDQEGEPAKEEEEEPPSEEGSKEKPPTEEAPTEKPPEEAPPSSETPPEETTQAPEALPALEEMNKQWQVIRATAEETLAKEHYALSDEMVEELQNSADTAIPKLAAKIYMDAVQASITHVVTQLPDLVSRVIETQKVVAENEKAFYATWPDLVGHETDVKRLAVAYRQVYPNAKPEDVIRDVGAQAMVALRIPIENGRTQSEDLRETKPHKPAGAGSPPASPPKPGTKNPFTRIAEELGEEELDFD